MPRTYDSEFRRRVVELVRGGWQPAVHPLRLDPCERECAQDWSLGTMTAADSDADRTDVLAAVTRSGLSGLEC